MYVCTCNNRLWALPLVGPTCHYLEADINRMLIRLLLWHDQRRSFRIGFWFIIKLNIFERALSLNKIQSKFGILYATKFIVPVVRRSRDDLRAKSPNKHDHICTSRTDSKRGPEKNNPSHSVQDCRIGCYNCDQQCWAKHWHKDHSTQKTWILGSSK